jgi:transcriptional regulator with XRE-family HTH domain
VSSKKSPSTITEEHESVANKSSAVQFLEKITGGPLTFGSMLQSIRLGEEKSLGVFAKLLDVSRTNLSDIEHGRRGVSVERAARWAELLGYSQTQFVRLAMQAQLDQAGLELYAQVTRTRPNPDTPRSVKPRKRTRTRSRVVTAVTGKRRQVA